MFVAYTCKYFHPKQNYSVSFPLSFPLTPSVGHVVMTEVVSGKESENETEILLELKIVKLAQDVTMYATHIICVLNAPDD